MYLPYSRTWNTAGYARARAPNCYLDMLDKLQKRISRAAGPSLAASLDPLVHRPNATGLSIFYRYYFGRCSSGLVSLSYS